ncbi:DUF4011 domain-containing protein [Arthrobacter sp. YN]|uniref:DUF4011 domain-containing protein n=1 Tax=Arthrobacter sp. YN TaxID=2020486 RepID=UPI000B61C40B|nr:DUF4011 domain-containing protein [Arthrobacter sp. YN]ASN19318.1 hypothetical protein CGK93_06150 [Arthrobacter sp. YN]
MRLHQRSEQEYADRGVWTLYIAYGMLNWMDPADSKSISSPLLWVPVRLTRDGQNYRIDRTEGEPTLNTALALKLSRDFGVRLPELDDEDLTAASVFGAVRSAVAKEPNWTVDERVVLSIFSFHKEAMYRDLEENESRITSRGLIQLLAVGPESPSSSKFPFDPVRDEDLDGTLAPEKLHSILDADGSQRKCILAARDGHSFIMDGPPGTGKSQTIANMIAELMAVGKTVLFVSEKAAALDVVRDRLAQRQMEPFLLELHSHKATRKHVVQTLHAELTRRPMARSTFSDTDRSQLIKSRTRLSDYAEAMNEIRRPLGRSLHEVLGRLSQLADHDDHPAGSPDILSSLTADVLAEIKMTASSLAQVWRPAEKGEYFPWTGLDGAGLSQDRIKELERVLQALSVQAERVSRTSNLVDSQLPFWTVDMDINGVRSRSAVVKLLTDKRSIPHSWYVCDLASILKTLDSVEEREKQLDGLESEVNNQSNKRWVADDRKLISPLNALLSSDPKVYSSVLADCSLKQMQELHETVEKVARALHDLAGRAGELGKLFNLNQSSLTLNKCRALAALAELSQQGSLPEADWINASIQEWNSMW